MFENLHVVPDWALALALARYRALAPGYDATCRPVEQLHGERTADALLFFYTHDVLQSPAALERAFARARPGARVVVAGARFLPWWWGAPLNLWTAVRARRYLTTYHGLSRPWRFLERFAPDFALIPSNFLGSGYFGTGTFNAGGR